MFAYLPSSSSMHKSTNLVVTPSSIRFSVCVYVCVRPGVRVGMRPSVRPSARVHLPARPSVHECVRPCVRLWHGRFACSFGESILEALLLQP